MAKFISFEMNTVDVFVGNYTVIDEDVYKLWLDGYTATDAASILTNDVIKKYPSATMDLIMSDTLDHFRTYQMLERLLQHPTKFAEQLTFQIDPRKQKHLIETYYEFDNIVIREILGKKLSSRHRKDLDEVSEKTKVSLKSCRRQFDNVKRVFKIVEDLRGRLVHNIQSHFLLSDKLARKYAAIVFIVNNRFETGKRKLQYLNFDDFLHCATCMIVSWSCNSTHIKPDDTDADLDREYLQELREVKILLEREVMDEHRALVCNRLKGKLNDRMYAEMESSFKSISRTLVSIACGLNHSREARDIFVDFVEKFIEPCKHAKWTRGEMEMFLLSYMDTVHDLDAFKPFPALRMVWDRYIHTASSCILCMFHP